VSMRIGRWPELSAEHKGRYTGNDIFLVMTMSKTSGVAEGLYGFGVTLDTRFLSGRVWALIGFHYT